MNTKSWMWLGAGILIGYFAVPWIRGQVASLIGV